MKPEEAATVVRELLDECPEARCVGVRASLLRALLEGFEAAVGTIRDICDHCGWKPWSNECKNADCAIAAWLGPEPGGLSEEALCDAAELLGGPPDGFIICGVDLANGPDYTVYGDGRMEPNPNWQATEPGGER